MMVALRAILVIIFSVAVCGIAYALHHDGYIEGRADVKAEWDKDILERKNLADQQQKNKERDDAKSKAATQAAQKAYADVKSERDAALRRVGELRLCADEVVSGGASVRVAEAGSRAVPGKTNSTAGIDDTLALAASFDFASAMKDRDQCTALIGWVCGQGFCAAGVDGN